MTCKHPSIHIYMRRITVEHFTFEKGDLRWSNDDDQTIDNVVFYCEECGFNAVHKKSKIPATLRKFTKQIEVLS